MKRLYILRHAKSSWASPGLGDIDRPLNARGSRQAELLNVWLQKQAFRPAVVVCSPSIRTLQTYNGIAEAVSSSQFETVERLYHGSLDDYLQTIWAVSDAEQSLMIIGHNPACDELVRYIVKSTSPAFDKLMAHHFGTANLAVFDCELDTWADMGRRTGSLLTTLRPKDIEQTG